MASRARTKYYILKKGRHVSIYTGRSPRQAALKAATRGVTEIKLRERGRRNKDRTYSVHIFKGGRQKVTLGSENRPDWLPSKVWKPRVNKVRVERVKTLR
ncbi:MAG: chromosomal protein MC1 [Candidatus Aenigmarchaeota archaeon]|nr:chromosomal protein MC1 [Candidatus Aenigmarchaeota archaeon]